MAISSWLRQKTVAYIYFMIKLNCLYHRSLDNICDSGTIRSMLININPLLSTIIKEALSSLITSVNTYLCANVIDVLGTFTRIKINVSLDLRQSLALRLWWQWCWQIPRVLILLPLFLKMLMQTLTQSANERPYCNFTTCGGIYELQLIFYCLENILSNFLVWN